MFLTNYYKYPRTIHHLDSGYLTADDKMMHSDEHLIGKQIVVTLKLDGENTNLYPDYMHARSLSIASHFSQNWVKDYHYKNIAPNLPQGFRVCAENLFASHSITYTELESYLYGFSIWDEDVCLSWTETLEWFELLNIIPVPTVYEGVYDRALIQKLFKDLDKSKNEGLVIRLQEAFKYADFSESVCKLVRPNHVTSSTHWKFKKIIPNQLKRTIKY